MRTVRHVRLKYLNADRMRIVEVSNADRVLHELRIIKGRKDFRVAA